MIAAPKTDSLANAVMSGVVHEGLTVTTRDGRRARLAVIDDDGNVIESGAGVEREAWNVAIAVYRNFLAGKGHLRVHTKPPGGVVPLEPR